MRICSERNCAYCELNKYEKNIRKNLEYSDTLYEIASDQIAKKKLIQVALKTMFRLKKEKPDKDLVVRVATIDELKKNGFKEWFETLTPKI